MTPAIRAAEAAWASVLTSRVLVEYDARGVDLQELIARVARALRGGAIIVGTRRGRHIRLPDVLLLDGPRVLTDGLELSTILPLVEDFEPTEILGLAGGIAAAAGSPWGNAFSRSTNVPAEQGTFNGLWASAVYQGAHYTLGPSEAPERIADEHWQRFRHHGTYLLELHDNDADRPLALLELRPRLSPGVAMGRAGTEVARQAADLVLGGDDFATLVEALVEGRGFWGNMRRGLSLLLGGNVGELGLIVGSSVLGLGTPLNTAQILMVNLITDALPALAVVLQEPEHRDLAGLAREGVTALDTALRGAVMQRGVATALPAFAAYLAARRYTSQPGSVAFACIVGNQLAQTLDAGRVEGALSRSVLSAVAGSTGLLVSALTVPPLQRLLGLATPSPLGWSLIGASAAGAVAVNRALSLANSQRNGAG